MAIALSCAGSRAATGSPSKKSRSAKTTAAESDLRKTQQQVQSQLMSFADRFFAGTFQAAWELQEALPTPQARQDAATERLTALLVTTDIAAGPNPGSALLDMAVYVTLKRMVWEDYWGPQVYGDAAANMIDAYRIMEADIWEVAAGVYSPEELADLRRVIEEWRAKHPDQVSIGSMRLAELSDSRQISQLVEAGKPGGLLAPVKEANRNIEEMRMLAERMVFMLNRMQLSVNLQLDIVFANLANQPEVQGVLTDTHTFADVADRVGTSFSSLVDGLPEERAAAIDQVFAGVSEERERIFNQIGSEEEGVRPAVAEVRQLVEAATLLSQEGRETIQTVDAMITGMAERRRPGHKKFDILEYQATVQDTTVLAREALPILAALERIIESPGFEQNLPAVVASANALEEEVINQIVDRLFLRVLLLILVFFAALVGYSWIAGRMRKSAAG
jgi:hypothetical protein